MFKENAEPENVKQEKEEMSLGKKRRPATRSISEIYGSKSRRTNSAEIKEFKKMLIEALGETGLDVGVSMYDKVNDNLDYGIVIITHIDNGNVYYYGSVLAPTGVAYLPGSEVINIMEGESDGNLTLPGVALNREIIPTIEADLVAEYGDLNLVYLEGLVTHSLTDEDGIWTLADSAVQAFKVAKNEVRAADILEALQNERHLTSKLSVTTIPGSKLEVIEGDTRYANVLLGLTGGVKRTSRLPNSNGSHIPIAETAAYVTVIPNENNKGMLELYPEVVITMADNPSVSFAGVFPAIYNSTALSVDRAWLGVLANTAKHDGKQIGTLKSLGVDKSGKREQIIKFSKNDSIKEIIKELNGMIEDKVIYSMIIKSYFYGGTMLSPFVSIAHGDIATSRKVIEMLSDITGGRFDPEFDPTNIIAVSSQIYGGIVNKGNGETAPLESIDLVDVVSRQIANKSIPPEIVDEYISIMILGNEASEVDKLKIYEILGYDVMVNTEMTKITFTGEFMAELIDAFSNTVFDAPIPKGIGIKYSGDRIDFGRLGSFINNATSDTGRRNTFRDGRGTMKKFSYGSRSKRSYI